MKTNTHSLVAGKFCPLHKGHVSLINKARLMGEVTVVIYDVDGFPQFPIDMRVQWIAKLFPDLKAIIPIKDQFNADSSAEASPLYAAQLEPFGPFHYVISSEDYGPPFAKALNAQHIMFDYDRGRIPISASKIRSDPLKYRKYVPDVVYRDMIQKVAFMGGESTGKSTIARILAERHNTQWVHEYGRELWEEQGGTGTFSDFLKIGKEQYYREEKLILDSDKYLFCDTTALTTEYWCRRFYHMADHRLTDLVSDTQDEYMYFLCSDDFDFVQDGLRETEEFHAEFHQGIIDDLDHRGIHYEVLTGSIEDRINQVEASLG
jgi:HTH-type transcriptional repressor of NAD biosynthesis genes